MSRAVQWNATGTTNPKDCNIFDIMARSERGEGTTSTEVIISYHYLDKALATEIATHVLDPQQAELFNKLRAIDPMIFQPKLHWWQFFTKPRTITWRDYATYLGYHDDDSWWMVYKGISTKIIDYLKTRTQSN